MRFEFGGDLTSFVISKGTGDAAILVPGAVLTFYTAQTGGTQIVDLTTLDGTAITSVTADSNGAVSTPLRGPDGVVAMWGAANAGARALFLSSNALPTHQADIAALQTTVSGLESGAGTGTGGGGISEVAAIDDMFVLPGTVPAGRVALVGSAPVLDSGTGVYSPENRDMWVFLGGDKTDRTRWVLVRRGVDIATTDESTSPLITLATADSRYSIEANYNGSEWPTRPNTDTAIRWNTNGYSDAPLPPAGMLPGDRLRRRKTGVATFPTAGDPTGGGTGTGGGDPTPIYTGTFYGASAPTLAGFNALQTELKTELGVTEPVMKARHPFVDEPPATYLDSPVSTDVGLGLGLTLLRCEVNPRNEFADEYVAWKAAGRPTINNGTTYPHAWVVVRSIRAHRDGQPASYTTIFDSDHEPENDWKGKTGVSPQTGTTLHGWEPGAREDWNKCKAFFMELVYKERGSAKILCASTLMGDTYNGGNYPNSPAGTTDGGAKRNPDHWNWVAEITTGTGLTSTQKTEILETVAVNGVDVYQWNSGPTGNGPFAKINNSVVWAKGKGLKIFGVSETAAQINRTASGALESYEPNRFASNIGNPNNTTSLRYAAERLGLLYVMWFHSSVNYTPPATGELPELHTKRSYGQAALGIQWDPNLDGRVGYS